MEAQRRELLMRGTAAGAAVNAQRRELLMRGTASRAAAEAKRRELLSSAAVAASAPARGGGSYSVMQGARRELQQVLRREFQHEGAAAGAAAAAAGVAAGGAAKAAASAYAGAAEEVAVLQALRWELQSRERCGGSCTAEGARPLFTVRCPSDASALPQALRKERPWSAHSTGSAGGREVAGKVLT